MYVYIENVYKNFYEAIQYTVISLWYNFSPFYFFWLEEGSGSVSNNQMVLINSKKKSAVTVPMYSSLE